VQQAFGELYRAGGGTPDRGMAELPVAQQQSVSSANAQSADESIRLLRLTGAAVFVSNAGEQSPALYFLRWQFAGVVQ